LRGTARDAEIDAGQLARIEKGAAQPTVHVLYRLAHVLKLRDLERHLKPFVRQ
jgi:transcriptional regulator with XRE-family HTH domain